MKNTAENIVFYARLIMNKWVFWVMALLDLIAFIALLLYPAFRLPQVALLFVTLIGFFWAGFQVYSEKPNSLQAQPIKALPYDLLPLSFEIQLQSQVPEIRVNLYVVNYQSKELVVDEFKVTEFTLSGTQSLDIPISHPDEIRIQSKQSRLVACHRPLIESEVRLIMSTQKNDRANATFLAAARVHLGHKHLNNSFQRRSISGRILGIPVSSGK